MPVTQSPARNFSGKVVSIVGPTGSGKTAAAVSLAARWPVGVINADSRQVYRDFPRITAQPSAEEQSACPHLLYGYLDSRQKVSAGAWAARATACVDELHSQGRLPVLLGGTGLYLRALFDGIAEIPPVAPHIAAELERQCGEEGGPARLHARLQSIDPAYAARIHPNDRQRIVRALEVWEGTGKTLSWWHAHPYGEEGAAEYKVPDWQVLRIGLNISRQELLPRLAQRIDAMLEQGALEEARAALEKCPDSTAPAWSGIGCAELYAHLSGELGLDECRRLWLRNTSAYAKRQMTWFKADRRIVWVAYNDAPALAALLDDFVSM